MKCECGQTYGLITSCVHWVNRNHNNTFMCICSSSRLFNLNWFRLINLPFNLTSLYEMLSNIFPNSQLILSSSFSDYENKNIESDLFIFRTYHVEFIRCISSICFRPDSFYGPITRTRKCEMKGAFLLCMTFVWSL